MKIVAVDNYDREGPGHDDILIAESVAPKYGLPIIDMLNKLEHQNYDRDHYFMLKEDDYKLKKFEP